MSKAREPEAAWETITPQMASEMLEASHGNRQIRQINVRRWSEDMKAGRFSMNGESIKFGTTGALLDGHHRLTAVVLANVPVRMLVVRGITSDAAKMVDAGSSRTSGDRLAMDGERNTNVLAGALMWQVRYENAADSLPARGSVVFRTDDVFVALAAHPGMREAAAKQFVYTVVRSILSPSLLAFCLYNTPNSTDFWRSLDNGAALDVGSPVLLLRNRLIADKTNKARLQEQERLALTIKAHNAWRRGQRTVSLRWRNTGVSPESFPRWIA